jgi:cytosolic carboxypeptidase protein 2/3
LFVRFHSTDFSSSQDYLNEIQNDRFKSQYCKQKILCRTLAGNFVYMLTITSPTASSTARNHPSSSAEHQVKKGVVITARVHPGETNASWMMKGLLDFLLGDSADAQVKHFGRD